MAFNKGKALANAQKYVLQGKYELAIEEYKKIVQENPKDWNTVIQIGNLYLKIGKNHDAINNLKKVADYYFTDGQHVKAIAIYKQINRVDPAFDEVSLKLTDLFIKQGLIMEAKSQLIVLGEHFNKKGQAKQASEVFRRLIELEPDNIKAKIELARTYKVLNDVKAAITEYLSISEEYEKQNLLQESFKILEIAIEIEPSNAVVLKKISSYYNKIGAPEKAIKLLEKQMHGGIPTAEGLMQLSEAYSKQHKFDQAENILHKCIELDSTFIPAFQSLLQLLIDRKDNDSARALVEDLTLQLIQKKESEKAIPFLKKMLEVEQTDSEIAEKLVEIYKELHQENNAIATLHLLMDSLLAEKEYAKASGIVNKLIAIEPDNTQYQEKQKYIEGLLRPKAELPKKEPPKVVVPKKEIPKVEAAKKEVVKEAIPKKEPPKAEVPKKEIPKVEAAKKEVVKEKIPPKMPPKPGAIKKEAFLEEESKAEAPVTDEEFEIDLEMPPEESPQPEKLIKEAEQVQEKMEDLGIGQMETQVAETSAAEETPAEEPITQIEIEEKQEFVREHMIEAEVFNKYGLVDKAVDQLELIVNRYPDVIEPYLKLKDIFIDKNKRDRAVSQYLRLINIFKAKGEADKVDEFIKAAKAIDPKNPELLLLTGAPSQPGDVLDEFEKLQAIYTSKKPAKESPKKAEFKALDDLELEIDITRDIEDIASIKEMMEQKSNEEVEETVPPDETEETVQALYEPTQASAEGMEESKASEESEPQAIEIEIELETPSVPEPQSIEIEEKSEAPAESSELEALETEEKYEVPSVSEQALEEKSVETDNQELVASTEMQTDEMSIEESSGASISDETIDENEFEIQIPENLSPQAAFDEEVAQLPETHPDAKKEEVNEEELIAHLEKTKVTLSRTIIESIDKKINLGEYEKAAEIIQDAREKFGDHPRLMEKLQEIESFTQKAEDTVASESKERGFSELEDSIDNAFNGLIKDKNDSIDEREEEKKSTMDSAETKEEIQDVDEVAQESYPESGTVQNKSPELEQELSIETHLESEELSVESAQKELEFESEKPKTETLQEDTMDFAVGITEEELEHEIEESFGDSKKKEETSSTHEMKVQEIFSEVPKEEIISHEESNEELKLDEEEIESALKEGTGGMEEIEPEEVEREELKQVFKDEENFFDLASELEKEMLSVQTAVEPEKKPEEAHMSLEEMFSEFKKGVEKQIDSQDYETRYNLGIAYKEMGLLDEAIAEFQIAAKDPKKFLECCSLLGICFIEKGLPKLAIKWYEKGLAAPGFADEEYQSLRYDLAQTYETIGEFQHAYDIFLDVYSNNATYRDVAQKLKDLESVIKQK